MDINALRVFDSLYRLGISDAEFADIDEESKQTERTGLSIKAVKKGYSVCVSHDQKHQIIIKKIKFNNRLAKPKTRVLFKTLINFEDIPREIYILHQIAQYRALDTEIKYTANNLEELKDRICDRFSDKYLKALGEYYNPDYCYDYDKKKKYQKLKKELIQKQLKALFWLFNEDFNKFNPLSARKNIPRIIKVFQRNNRRIALIFENEDYQKQRGGIMQCKWYENIKDTTIKIQTYTPNNPQYNYTAPNREIYIPNGWNDKTEIWLDDNLFEKITAEELRVLSKRVDNEWMLLTADEYNNKRSALKIELMRAKREDAESKAKSILTQSIKRQFSNGKITRHGITFTKNHISFNGIKLSGDKIGEYITSQNILFTEQPSFTDIFNGYIDYILNYEIKYDYYTRNATIIKPDLEKDQTLTIGNIKSMVESKGNGVYINNKRINNQDIGEILKKSASYKSQEEYDDFLKYTSRVSLKLQQALKDGVLSFTLRVDQTDDNSLIKNNTQTSISIPIHRSKGRTYAKIENKLFKVKNIQSLFDLEKNIDSFRMGHSGGGYIQRTIKLLYKAIDRVSSKEIGNLIKNGIKENRKITKRVEKERLAKIKRSEEFISHAVKITNAIKVDKGYFVDGISGLTYFVDENTLGVWTIKDGKQDKYLCVVDTKTNTEDEPGKNDAVAKRLLMLSKDKIVSSEIYENGDKMDSHWLEISGNKKKNAII